MLTKVSSGFICRFEPTRSALGPFSPSYGVLEQQNILPSNPPHPPSFRRRVFSFPSPSFLRSSAFPKSFLSYDNLVELKGSNWSYWQWKWFTVYRLSLKGEEELAGQAILHLMTFLFKMVSAPLNASVHLRIPVCVDGPMYMVITLTGREPMVTRPVSELDRRMTIQQELLTVRLLC